MNQILMRRNDSNKESGFTLIELLVVIAIIGLLSSVILASLNSARKKGRDARRLADLKQLQTALELYNSDNASYPKQTSLTNMSSLVLGPTYMSAIPTDPLGSSYPYKYISDSLGQSYCLGTTYFESTAPATTCTNPAASTIGTATGYSTYSVGP